MASDVERIAEVIAAHSSVEYDSEHWEYICSECGEAVAGGYRQTGYQTLHEHQARMLIAAGLGHVPTALHQAADELEAEASDSSYKDSSYATDAWLGAASVIRDRADRAGDHV